MKQIIEETIHQCMSLRTLFLIFSVDLIAFLELSAGGYHIPLLPVGDVTFLGRARMSYMMGYWNHGSL